MPSPRGMGRMHFLEENETPPKITRALFFRIIGYFRPYKARMALASVAILAAAMLGLVPPLLLKSIVDTALPQKNLVLLAQLVGLSVGATAMLSLIQVGQTYLNTWVSKHIVYNMKNEMFTHLQAMSLGFFSSAKPGEIITRMNSDIDGIQDIFNSTAVNALNSFFVLLTTSIALFAMNWKLALLGIATVPLFVIPTRRVGRVRWKIALKSQEKLSELNEVVQETMGISGSILMKIFTTEPSEADKFRRINRDVIGLQIREALAGRWFIMTISIFTTIGPMLVYFFGGMLLARGALTIGGIITFATLLTKLYGPVVQISNIHIDVTRSFALFGRIFDYLDRRPEIVDRPGAGTLRVEGGRVDFTDVTFSYTGKREALHGVSFTAEPGKMTALVGPSGAGKTTITNLIPRLYEVTGGSVAIDGQDIRTVTLRSLRRQIGLVMQEPYLFNATVRDNLVYGNPTATQEEIETACRTAYIHDFILSLPNGYDTVVGNRGIKLSGGEKQRISIARVLLKNPRIIVMDEATSSLDSVSEYYIQKAMVPLLAGRTSIVIAHRLSTILGADRILVVEDGHIVDAGRHAELLTHGGLYRQLYETQFKTQAQGAAARERKEAPE